MLQNKNFLHWLFQSSMVFVGNSVNSSTFISLYPFTCARQHRPIINTSFALFIRFFHTASNSLNSSISFIAEFFVLLHEQCKAKQNTQHRRGRSVQRRSFLVHSIFRADVIIRQCNARSTTWSRQVKQRLSILTWRKGYNDQQGCSLGVRLFHCTIGLS